MGKMLKLRYFRIALAAFILLSVVISAYLAYHPIRLGQGDFIGKESEGKSFLAVRDSDFLLLISEKRIREENDFYGKDWSYAWLNTLMQEAGSYSVQDADNQAALNGRVIIVSRSALGMDSKLRNEIKSFTESGGLLVIEEPTAEWDFVHNIKDIKRAELQNKSLFSGNLGKGSIIVLNFNYGLYLTSMQQGTPNPDFSVSDRHGRPDMVDTQDLVSGREMLDNSVPYADIMERTLFNLIETLQPVPRAWYYPDSYAGAVIVSHDEDFFGDKTTYLSDYEDSINATATFFVVSDSGISKEGISRIGEEGDIGIHWNRDKGFSIWKFRPFRSDNGLSRQIAKLQKKSGQEIIANRLHYLNWGSDYTKTFRNLYQAGIKIDSSYGPNIGRGYLFGTGQPFYALDNNGLVIPVIEIPFQTQETWGNADEYFLEKLMNESRERYHETIISNFHPHYSEAGGESRKLLEKNFELAKEYDHWIANFREYYGFMEKRNGVLMTSSFDSNMLLISVHADSETTIMAPYEYSGLKISKAEVNGNPAGFRKMSVEGMDYALIKIPEGKSNAVVEYG